MNNQMDGQKDGLMGRTNKQVLVTRKGMKN